MSSALRRLAQQAPQLTRGFTASGATKGGVEKWSHKEVVFGDGHHGLRKGYNYDFEHGPHYLNPRKVDNFMMKWNVGLKVLFGLGISIPCFAVWWQQRKMSAA